MSLLELSSIPIIHGCEEDDLKSIVEMRNLRLSCS